MKTRFLFAVVAIITTCAGCRSGLQQYRPWDGAQQTLPTGDSNRDILRYAMDSIVRNPGQGSNFLFSVIEFDDQGEMWNRNQLVGTLNMIRDLKSSGHPVTLLAFVHGWKHDASDYSYNLTKFRKYVQDFSASFAGNTNSSCSNDYSLRLERKVVGVYFAWRGNTYEFGNGLAGDALGLPRQISFYNRKDTAARVAGISCTEAIVSLSAMARLHLNTNSCPMDSKVMIIGHSLGGLIVERAISQAMLGAMLVNAVTVGSREAIAKPLLDEADRLEKEAGNKLLQATNIQEFLRQTNLHHYVTNQTIAYLSKLHEAEREQRGASASLSMIESNLYAAEQGSIDRYHSSGASARWRDLMENRDGPGIDSFIKQLADDLKLEFSDTQWNSFQKIKDELPNAFRARELKNHAGALTNAVADLKTFVSNFFDGVQIPAPQANRIQAALDLLTRLAAEPKIADYSINLASNRAATADAKRTLELADTKLDQASREFESAKGKATADYDAWIAKVERLKKEAKQHLEDAGNNRRIAGNPRLDAGRPLADLILLANPASEALVAKMMGEAFANPLITDYTTLTNRHRPWIVSVTSKADDATGFWFGFGRFFSGFFEDFHPYPTNEIQQVKKDGSNQMLAGSATQKDYYQRTAGHLSPLVSHVIERRSETNYGSNLKELLNLNLSTNAGTFSIYTPDGEYQLFSNTSADRINHTCYWVIQTEKDLIKDHNDIFTPKFFSLASALYRISTRTDANPSPDTPLPDWLLRIQKETGRSSAN